MPTRHTAMNVGAIPSKNAVASAANPARTAKRQTEIPDPTRSEQVKVAGESFSPARDAMENAQTRHPKNATENMADENATSSFCDASRSRVPTTVMDSTTAAKAKPEIKPVIFE